MNKWTKFEISKAMNRYWNQKIILSKYSNYFYNVIIICFAIGIKKKWKKNLDKLLNMLKITWIEMQQNLKIVMRIKHHFKILLQKFSFTNYTYIYKFYYM